MSNALFPSAGGTISIRRSRHHSLDSFVSIHGICLYQIIIKLAGKNLPRQTLPHPPQPPYWEYTG